MRKWHNVGEQGILKMNIPGGCRRGRRLTRLPHVDVEVQTNGAADVQQIRVSFPPASHHGKAPESQ